MDDNNEVQETTARAETPTPTTAPETANPTPAPQTQPTGKPAPRPKMSEVERIAQWRDKLLTAGYSPKSTDLVIDYARKATTFELDAHGAPRPGGGLLVIMFVRLATRLKDAPSVSVYDVEDANAELLRFFKERPLGDTVQDWRGQYATNGLQRQAIDGFFGFLGKRIHELEPGPRFLFSIRDAAWPSRKEEAAGIGGTFAERLTLFAKSICRIFMTSGDTIEKFFDSFYHVQEEKLPDWIDTAVPEGEPYKCKRCGSPVEKDKNDQWICSSLLCDHNIAPTGAALPESFTSGSPAPRQRTFSSPDRPPRRGNGGGREDHEDDFQPRKKFKKTGPRYRERDIGDEGGAHDNGGSERVIALNGSGFSNTIGETAGAAALDGLNLQ